MILNALARALALRGLQQRTGSPLSPSLPPAPPPEEVSEYEEELRKLPEPLRSHIRRGGFLSNGESWPLILPEWVDDAFNRWSGTPPGPMTALGVAVTEDRLTLALRHGDWFDLRTHEGIDPTDGPAVAALIFAARRGRCEIGFDLRSGDARPAHDHLKAQGFPVEGCGTEGPQHVRSGFPDMHSVIWWAFREALDPANPSKIALPPDAALKEDLEALRWTLTETGIRVEPGERLMDRAEAVVNAWACSGERMVAGARRQTNANIGYVSAKQLRAARVSS